MHIWASWWYSGCVPPVPGMSPARDVILVWCTENKSMHTKSICIHCVSMMTFVFALFCYLPASKILLGLSPLSVLSQAVLLSSAEAQHTLRLWPNLTKLENTILEKDKTVHGSSGGRVIWFQRNLTVWLQLNRNQPTASHFRTQGSAWFTILVATRQRRVPHHVLPSESPPLGDHTQWEYGAVSIQSR